MLLYHFLVLYDIATLLLQKYIEFLEGKKKKKKKKKNEVFIEKYTKHIIQ